MRRPRRIPPFYALAALMLAITLALWFCTRHAPPSESVRADWPPAETKPTP